VERLHWRQAFVDMCSIPLLWMEGFFLNDNVIIFLFKIRASIISLVDFAIDNTLALRDISLAQILYYAPIGYNPPWLRMQLPTR
jgi:hypothetical protein